MIFVQQRGKSYSIKDFINIVASNLDIRLKWKGSGKNEYALDIGTNKKIIRIDERYFRPNDIDSLTGDYSKAKKILQWKPKINFLELVKEMVTEEISRKNL